MQLESGLADELIGPFEARVLRALFELFGDLVLKPHILDLAGHGAASCSTRSIDTDTPPLLAARTAKLPRGSPSYGFPAEGAAAVLGGSQSFNAGLQLVVRGEHVADSVRRLLSRPRLP